MLIFLVPQEYADKLFTQISKIYVFYILKKII